MKGGQPSAAPPPAEMAAWQRLARLRELPLQLMLIRSAGSPAFSRSKLCAFAQQEISLSNFAAGQTRLLSIALHGSTTGGSLSNDSARCNSVLEERTRSGTHTGTEAAVISPTEDLSRRASVACRPPSSNIGGRSEAGVILTGGDIQRDADAGTNSAAATLSSGSSYSRAVAGVNEGGQGSSTGGLRRVDLAVAQKGSKRTSQWTEQWEKFMDLLYQKVRSAGRNNCTRLHVLVMNALCCSIIVY